MTRRLSKLKLIWLLSLLLTAGAISRGATVGVAVTMPLGYQRAGGMDCSGYPADGGHVGKYISDISGLPSGLSPYYQCVYDNAYSVVLMGTPTVAGTYTITVNYEGGSKDQIPMVVAPPLSITTTSLPVGSPGVAYNATLAASGGTPNYSYSIAGGALPPGLNLSSAGQIYGTPTTNGTYGFQVKALDLGGASYVSLLSIQISPPLGIATSSLPAAQQGVAYNQALQTTGGTPGYTWTLTGGTLPAGVQLVAAGGLAGTPTVNGTFSFTLSVTDSGSPAAGANRTFTLTVNPGFTITTPSLPSGQPAVSYSAALSSSNGTTPYSYAAAFGSLPPGLALSGMGTISGTPTQAGSYSVQIRATDAAGNVADQQFVISITSAARITTTTVPDGAVGAQLSTILKATNGVAPYFYTVASGNLPPGVSLDPMGWLIGTPATAGTYTFAVKVTDASNVTDTMSYTTVISGQLLITTPALPGGIQNVGYSQGFAAVGGKAPYMWVVSSGTLPPGLTLTSLGTLAGTPTTPGAYSFTVAVTDSSATTQRYDKAMSLVIGAPLAITSGVLPNAKQGAQYSQVLTASGVGSGSVWTVSAGSLPQGISLQPNGTLTGAPTTTGSYTFAVSVTDASGQVASAQLTLIVDSGFSISTASLSDATLNVPYSLTLATSAGTAPYTFSLTFGALPPGMVLSASGTLSGTPTQAGSYSLAIQAVDVHGLIASHQYVLKVASVMTFSPLVLLNGTVDVGYLQTISVSGGVAPYSYAVTNGTVPAGLALVETGDLSGVPTTAGSYTFTVQATDGSGATAMQQYTVAVAEALKIGEATAPGMSTGLGEDLPAGTVNTPYSAVLHGIGGRAPYNWSTMTGTLPPGLTLSPLGVISGTPTTVGLYAIRLQVSDASAPAAKGEKDYSIAINQPLLVTTSSLPGGTQGDIYQVQLSASGGTGPYIWSVASGSLPDGVQLYPQGILLGALQAIGSFSFNVTVTDSSPGLPLTNTVPLSVEVRGPLAITTTAINAVFPNTDFSQVLSAVGGDGPYQFRLADGSLPSGLELSAAGVLSGRATQAGAFPISVEVADSRMPKARTAQKQLTVLVDNPFALTSDVVPTAVVGTGYSFQLLSNSGRAPYAWSVSSGTLPDGLALSATAGVMAGTPTAVGTSTFEVTAADATGQTAVRQYTMTVAEPLRIATSALPSAVIGQPYVYVLPRVNGVGPYSWALMGQLPEGLELNPAGFISGMVPRGTTPGGTRIILSVTDGSLPVQQATQGYDFMVVAPLTLLTMPADVPAGSMGVSYSVALSAEGGMPGYTWAVDSGTLPDGLTLSAAGVISGLPTTLGESQVLISVTDQTGQKASNTYTIRIGDALTVSGSLSSMLSDAYIGIPYKARLKSTGGVGTVAWSLKSGTMPGGLTLDPDGTISGTPTEKGIFALAFAATSAGVTAQTWGNLTVIDPPPGLQIPLSTVILPTAYRGVEYTTKLIAANVTGTVEWTLKDGILPPGLVLAKNGTISGTATVTGMVAVTIQAKDDASTITSNYLVRVSEAIAIMTKDLPAASKGTAYIWQLLGQGGVLPYTWTIDSGVLPAGLQMSASGIISGTPTEQGVFPLAIKLTDSTSGTALGAKTNLILSVSQGMTITSTSLAEARLGSSYTAQLTATGGQPAYTWTLTQGNLPEGLTLSSSGAISGTATTAGVSNFIVTATDSAAKPQTASAQLSIVVKSALSITTSTLPAAVVGQMYSVSLGVSGGSGPFTWAITQGTLPAGLSFSTAGVISGTPTAAAAATLTFQVTDSNGQTATRPLSLTSGSAFAVTTTSLASAVTGKAYSATLAAQGGTTPYTWSIKSGSLPAGLTLSSGGGLSGTPTAVGTSAFTVGARDNTGQEATAALTLAVVASSQVIVVVDSTATPASQIPVSLKLAAASPVGRTCTLTLTFQPLSGGGEDATVQLLQGSTQQRTVSCTIAAGATVATFPGGTVLLATGTTAGTITLTGTVTETGDSGTATVTMPALPPEIRSVRVTMQSAGNFSVQVIGYSNTRAMKTAHFVLTYGATVNPMVDLEVSSLFASYYGSALSVQNGGVFTYTQPFTVTGSGQGALTSVTVSLSNSVGTSSTVTATP